MERARHADDAGREAEPTLGGLARDLVALELLRLRAAIDRRLTWLALGALSLLGVAVLVVVGSARLVLGLSAAISDALDAAPWAGDVIVGTALPSLGLAALVLAHRRRASRRMERADDLIARHGRADVPRRAGEPAPDAAPGPAPGPAHGAAHGAAHDAAAAGRAA